MTDLREDLAGRGILLGDEIGRGAAAVVYRAVDRRHVRPVAVKVFTPGTGGEAAEDRFLREIRLAAGLQHPHILPVYDSGTAGEALFYVMPYVDGESLRARLAREGRLPLREALRIAREVADALGFAHAHGVVHRDIKPENILLEGGHAVVTDFGVALAVERAGDDGRLTVGGVAVGSPAYMSPEQASGDPAVDGRSDIYSLGCVVYEMLAGEPPFSAISARGTVASRFLGPPVPLEQRLPRIPAEVSDTVQKALSLAPADRFQRMEEFAAAIGEPAIAPPAGRRRFRLRALAVLVVALTAAGVTLLPGRPPARRTGRLDPRRVAVATLSNETGERRLAPLGDQVGAWITDRVSRLSALEVVTSATTIPAGTRGTSDGPERLRALAEETRAGTLVTGSYYRGAKGTVEFHIDIVDANSGELLRAIGPVDGRGNADRVADELSRDVAGALDTLVAGSRTTSGGARDSAFLGKGRRGFNERDSLGLDRSLDARPAVAGVAGGPELAARHGPSERGLQQLGGPALQRADAGGRAALADAVPGDRVGVWHLAGGGGDLVLPIGTRHM
ncbi:MAG TPA: serine/threonine-protein kinase [Gemmatimonadales bacterium]